MHEIFISYSHKDLQWVSRLASILEKRGYAVWWDKELLFSQDYADVIEEALNSTKCVLTIWSSESVKSKWVRAESSRGFNQEIMLPVLIEDASIPIPYDSLHTADLREWDGDENDKAFVDFINALDWSLQRKNAVPATLVSIPAHMKKLPQPINLKKRTSLSILGLLVVFLGGLVYYFSSLDSDTSSSAAIECTSGNNSIVKAAGRGKVERVDECIKLGADVSLKDPNGWSALHAAAYNGNMGIARKLMATGKVDIESRTNREETPLYLASMKAVQVALKSKDSAEIKKIYDMINYLKSSGASTKVADENGQNLYSRVQSSPELLKLLFD